MDLPKITPQDCIGFLQHDVAQALETLDNYPAEARDYLRDALRRLEQLTDAVHAQRKYDREFYRSQRRAV